MDLQNDDEDHIEEIPVDLDHLNLTVKIETFLSVEIREWFINFFKKRISFFNQNAKDMARINP